MAEPYLSELRQMAAGWSHADARVGGLECRHFFSGASASRRGGIVASLTPVGLAFKVAAEIRDELLSRELAIPLRYFPTGPVKRGYVLFPEASAVSARDAARLILGQPPDAD